MDFIVLDLETTCWDGNPPTDIREIIEIAAFRLDRFGEINDRFHALVKPTFYPILSPYCRHLTGIDQEEINRATSFPKVFSKFIEFVEDSPDYRLCAWGSMDQKILKHECSHHDIYFEGLDHYIDIKQEYHEINRSKQKYGLMKSLRREGIEFEGDHHRAEPDAYNLAKLISRYIDQWIY